MSPVSTFIFFVVYFFLFINAKTSDNVNCTEGMKALATLKFANCEHSLSTGWCYSPRTEIDELDAPFFKV